MLLTRDPGRAAYFGDAVRRRRPAGRGPAALLAACAPRWPSGRAAAPRGALAALDALGDDGGPARWRGLRPVDLVHAVRRCAGDARLTVDAGAHMLAAMPLWPARRPHGVLISNGLATMGYALPAAIGAALARPGERVVCLTGDGGLGMVLAELETLARLALPVTVVVFDDAALSLIALKQRAEQGGPSAVRSTPVDFAASPRAMGVPAATADDVAGVAAALRGPARARSCSTPAIDPASYRHLMGVSRG